MPGLCPEPILGETVSGDWCVIPPKLSRPARIGPRLAVTGNDFGPASRLCSSSLAPFRPVGEGDGNLYVQYRKSRGG